MPGKHFPKSGFSLIEFLVVFTIISALTWFGATSYIRFNRNELLNQTAENLRSSLRDAQNRATVGEVDCRTNVLGGCGGTINGCGSTNDADERPFNGWRASFFTGSYTLEGRCGASTSFNSVTTNLPTAVRIATPTPAPVLFKTLGQGTDLTAQLDIVLEHVDTGETETVTVMPGGEIK
ncbi:prepilin-type N-terminal cleavage/methylation domain-containing protein [Candidatus Microgenomates bacterium]|nr:prepilin-type N-terminal cleavage/methylation domain-containing protein [Candidatus Microgenomates bacterium]